VRLTVTDPGGLSSSTTQTIVVVPLNCDVTAGSFRNPAGDPVANDILVSRNNRPVNSSFTFTATTNEACTSVTARLPYQGGALTVPLSLQSTVGGVKTWTGTTATTQQFNVGSSQNATMTGTDGAVQDAFTYTFNVHT
jgi:hypothetical protein